MFGKSKQQKSHTENFLNSAITEVIFNNKIPNNLRSHSLLLRQIHGFENSSYYQNCWSQLESNYRKSYKHLYQECLWEIRKDFGSKHSWFFSVIWNLAQGSEVARKRNRIRKLPLQCLRIYYWDVMFHSSSKPASAKWHAWEMK